MEGECKITLNGVDRKVSELDDGEVSAVLDSIFEDEDFVVLFFGVEQEPTENNKDFLGRLTAACVNFVGVPMVVTTNEAA